MSVKITKSLLKKIYDLACKATPPPWVNSDTGCITAQCNNDIIAINTVGGNNGQDLDYISAMSPDVAKAMVQEISRLRKDLVLVTKQLNWLAKYCEGEQNCPYLALGWENGRSEWCYCNDSPEDGFECDEDPVECWLKAACEATAGEYS